MKSLMTHAALPVVILAAAALTACGSGGVSSPLAPSALSNGSGGPTSTITGTVRSTSTSSTASTGSALTASTGTFHALDAGTGLTITVVGTGLTSSVGADGSFTITVPSGSVTLKFSGPGINATLTLDGLVSGEVRELSIHVSGGSAEVDSDSGEGQDLDVEGLITAIDTTALTITVDGKVIGVPAGTSITHGDTTFAFADLRIGDRVHVKLASSTAPLVAKSVNLQDGNATPGNGSKSSLTLSGAVSGLTGACPTLTFKVGTSTEVVKTSASTEFDGAACATLANGTNVEVKGAEQVAGTLIADSVDAGDSGHGGGGDHGNGHDD